MNILKPHVTLEEDPSTIEAQLKKLEKAGRICYKTEGKIKDDTYESFIRKIIDSGHESVIEHMAISFTIRTDVGITHQAVRHRIASFSQESTKFCNYSLDRFGGEINVLQPPFSDTVDEKVAVWYPQISEMHNLPPNTFQGNNVDTKNFAMNKLDVWLSAMMWSEWHYFQLIKMGAKAEEARSVLPKSLKADIMMTMNPRQWRWFFHERMSKHAHPQMRQISLAIFEIFDKYYPVFTSDYKETYEEVHKHFVAKYGAEHLVDWDVTK